MFYFDYGVVVFWGFTSKHTEQLVMHKVVEAVMSDPLDDEEVEIDEVSRARGEAVDGSCACGPQRLPDALAGAACCEICDRHVRPQFEYHYSGTERPNMKNDVVTLSLTMAGDPKVKLSIAHALAQVRAAHARIRTCPAWRNARPRVLHVSARSPPSFACTRSACPFWRQRRSICQRSSLRQARLRYSCAMAPCGRGQSRVPL